MIYREHPLSKKYWVERNWLNGGLVGWRGIGWMEVHKVGWDQIVWKGVSWIKRYS